MSTGRIRDEDLHDAVQVAAAALGRTDWKSMQPPAVAYIVLAEAIDLLVETIERYRREDSDSAAQRAQEAIAARNRAVEAERSQGVGPLPERIKAGWREVLQRRDQEAQQREAEEQAEAKR